MPLKRVSYLLPALLMLVLLAGWLELSTLGAAAFLVPSMTFTVNNTMDVTDANAGDGICETGAGNGICTLRAAVQEANATSISDTIIVPTGIYTLTIPGNDFDAAMGDLDILHPLTIVGDGREQTIIDGNQLDRVFENRNFTGGSVTLSDMTIQNGRPIGVWGGGIFNNSDQQLNLMSVVLRYNRARDGAGIFNDGDVLIMNSYIISNTSNMDKGGGMAAAVFNRAWLRSTTMTIQNTTIRNNTSLDRAAVLNYGEGAFTAHLTIEDSVIHHNTTVAAGAIGGGLQSSSNSVIAIVNSTLSHNSAGNTGLGGGIQVESGTVNINNSTIVSNTASAGGGVYRGGGTVTLHNTIVAHNSSGNCNMALTSSGYNLESSNSCGLSAAGDLINTDPLLEPLTNNGGNTWTHALNLVSPAIDAAENLNCPDFDQRGDPRPIDGNGDNNPVCDIGAFEFSAGVPFIAITDASVIEGDIDTIVTPAVFTITLSMTSTQTVTVTYATVDGTAQAGSDYYFATATIQFAPGQITCTVPVYVPGDTEVEPDETFFVVLSNPTNGVLSDGTGLGTIINDDFIIPDVSVGDRALLEGNSGTAAATFSVTLAVASNQTVTMTYTTLDGTAQSGIDYISSSGLVVFTPGQTSQLITVLINGDTEIESDETFTVELTNVINGTVIDGSGLGTILNDDVEASGSIVFLPLMLKP